MIDYMIKSSYFRVIVEYFLGATVSLKFLYS